MTSEPWGPLPLAVDDEVEKTLGDLRLRLQRRPDEVWMRAVHESSDEWTRRRDPEGGGSGDGPAPSPSGTHTRSLATQVRDEEWMRWAARTEDELGLRPVMPDRPVVVSPEQPFFLLPSGRARVFVRIPLFVRIQIEDGEGGSSTLEEVPSQVLSDTWWGSFTEGELGYWVETRARREMDPSLYEPHLAICPFILSNGSDQVLPVERFALRVSYLTLFGRGTACWTDEVLVR
ncbi:MAG: hypothetical protein R3304_12465, partial [Longimicrobiales bacterium]|nr:hypothetical protein [Longimicrobiales bacterium]